MNPAHRSSRTHQARGLARWLVHLAILALLLKAAVPLLASAAAALRGVPVAEVCDVYGVALAAPKVFQKQTGHAAHAAHTGHEHHAARAPVAEPDASSGQHGSDTGAHHGEHCALGALAALACSPFDAVAVPAAEPWQGAALPPVAATAPRDGCALWVARLKHGPPLQA